MLSDDLLDQNYGCEPGPEILPAFSSEEIAQPKRMTIPNPRRPHRDVKPPLHPTKQRMRTGKMVMPLLTFFLLATLMALAGCSSYLPVIHAQIPVPSPTPAPTPRPAQCASWGTCTAFELHPWGYCQWQTEQGPTTFVAQVEIGVMRTPTDPQDKHCNLLFGKNLGAIRAISGNVNYISEGVDRASMAMRILTPGYGPTSEWLAALKLAVHTKGEESLPFHQQFELPIVTQGLWVDFDDDLDGSKPTTLSVSFQGTLAQ